MQQAKNLAQVKNKLKNLEKEYKSVKGRMALTGREGALKIKEECEFFDEIDEHLGHRGCRRGNKYASRITLTLLRGRKTSGR